MICRVIDIATQRELLDVSESDGLVTMRADVDPGSVFEIIGNENPRLMAACSKRLNEHFSKAKVTPFSAEESTTCKD